MKSADLKVGVEYAVIPAWDYSSQEKKNPETTERRYVTRANLVSNQKYTYKVYRSESPDDTSFEKAEKGARSVGYLVVSDEYQKSGQANSTIYWLARPQDIVAEYAILEPKWIERELAETLAKEKRDAEAREYERKQREAREYQERVSQSLIDTLKVIIGDRVKDVRFETNNRRDQNGNYMPVSEVIVDLKTMGILVEKVLEAKDLVG